MKSSEGITIVLTTLLSFAGATAGSIIASHLEQTNWEKRYEIEYKKILYEKRVSLLERLITVKNKGQIAESLEYYYQYEQTLAACKPKKENPNESLCQQMTPDRIEKMAGLKRELNNLNAEFGAVASLAVIYFGKETRKAVQEFDS